MQSMHELEHKQRDPCPSSFTLAMSRSGLELNHGVRGTPTRPRRLCFTACIALQPRHSTICRLRLRRGA